MAKKHMTLSGFGRAILAGAFVVSFSGGLAAQDYQPITSEREFVSRMTERPVTLLHKSGSSVQTYHYNGG